jgi:hypothetical protein
MSWFLSAGQRVLITELNVEPDAKIQALYRSIIGG